MPNDHVPHPPDDSTDRNAEVVYLRIPSELRARIDAHRSRMQGEAPSGVVISRAAAIRHLLDVGLRGVA